MNQIYTKMQQFGMSPIKWLKNATNPSV